MNKKQSAILAMSILFVNTYADQTISQSKQVKSIESTNNSSSFKNVKVVNGYEVAANSEKGKKIKHDFLLKKEQAEKELQKIQAELVTANKEFTAKAPTLNEKARRDEEKRLAKLDRDLKEKAQALKEELEGEMYLQTEKLGQFFEKTVQEYGKEQDLDLVIDQSSGRPVYVAERLQCTSDIVALMNKSDDHKNKSLTTASNAKSASSTKKS